MQSLRLASNLRLFINRQSKCMVRPIYTTQINNESETSKLIRLRREREAKTEQTTGFDKMLNFNEFHIQIFRRNDNKEINRKRDLNMMKMLFNLAAFAVASIIFLAGIMHYLCIIGYINMWKVDRSYWID